MQQFRPQRFDILPPVVKNLLIINGLMYLATLAFPRAFGLDLVNLLGLHFFTSDLFRPHQLVTHMFMHGGFLHIFSNMFSLWMFGSTLENVWGPKRFLIFYLICGLGGAFLHLGVTAFQYNDLQAAVNAYLANPGINQFITLLNEHGNVLYGDYGKNVIDFAKSWESNPAAPGYINESLDKAPLLLKAFADVPIIGASGAVFGVLLGFGMLFPNTYLYLLFPPIPIKAKYFVIFYGLFELYAGFSGTQSGIAHFAHLGGMLFGFILIKYWNRTRRKDFF